MGLCSYLPGNLRPSEILIVYLVTYKFNFKTSIMKLYQTKTETVLFGLTYILLGVLVIMLIVQ